MSLKDRVFVKKIVIICPVRKASPEVQEKIQQYVKKLEKSGNIVHWPLRDNDQTDPIGLTICEQMRKAIKEANEVHIWYDPESEGTLFDFGMLFAFLDSQNKKVVIINRVSATPHKSYANVIIAIAQYMR